MFDHGQALQKCAAGDKAALKALYEHEAPQLLGVATRILGHRERAEDAVHDTFVQIWRKARQFDPDRGSPRGWIYTILRSRSLDMLRSGGRETAEEPAMLETRIDREMVDEAYDRLDDTGALKRCLAALDETKRRCILMAYVLGYTHGEIAGRIGTPLGTAKTWVRRGLEALRRCMS